MYVLVEGQAALEVDGEPVTMSPGDAVRVDPAAERQLQNGDDESTLVIAGAPWRRVVASLPGRAPSPHSIAM